MPKKIILIASLFVLALSTTLICIFATSKDAAPPSPEPSGNVWDTAVVQVASAPPKTPELEEPADTITAQAVSAALKVAINEEMWLFGEDTWHPPLNEELSYEYYIQHHKGSYGGNYGDYDKIAVVFLEPYQTSRMDFKGYFVHSIIKDEFAFDTATYSSRSWGSLEELWDTLEGYEKHGTGSVTFDNAHMPEYSGDSWQKYYMIENIAQTFMESRFEPEEVTELYILNFFESSESTRVMYAYGDDYSVSYFSMVEHRVFKPMAVTKPKIPDDFEIPEEFDDDFDRRFNDYHGDYYKEQFIKSAYKMDLTYPHSPRIATSPVENG